MHLKRFSLQPLKIKKILYWVSQKYCTELIERNFKLIALIYDMSPFEDSIQPNLNFEPSFVGICPALIERWLFEHAFQNKNVGLASKFWGYQICH